jgi:hypothetical protein
MMAHEFTAVVALNINEHERYALNRELIESFFVSGMCCNALSSYVMLVILDMYTLALVPEAGLV